MCGPASPYQFFFFFFLSYPLAAFYTELMEVSMLSHGPHNLSPSGEQLFLWLSFDPFPMPVDPIYNTTPDDVTILQGLTKALKKSGGVKMFSTAK